MHHAVVFLGFIILKSGEQDQQGIFLRSPILVCFLFVAQQLQKGSVIPDRSLRVKLGKAYEVLVNERNTMLKNALMELCDRLCPKHETPLSRGEAILITAQLILELEKKPCNP